MTVMIAAFRSRYGNAIAFPSVPTMRANLAANLALRRDTRPRPRSRAASHNRVPIGGRPSRRIVPVEIMTVTGKGGVLGAGHVPTARDRSARRWYPDYWQWRAEMRHWGR